MPIFPLVRSTHLPWIIGSVLWMAACGGGGSDAPPAPGDGAVTQDGGVDTGGVADGGSDRAKTPDGGSDAQGTGPSAGEAAPLDPFGMLKNIGKGTVGSRPRVFTRVGTRVFFAATGSGSVNPFQLWVTDGTREGTVLVPGVRPAADNPGTMAEVGGKVVLTGYGADINKQQIWVSDGTPEGTRVLVDAVREGAGAAISPDPFVRVGSKLYFTAYNQTAGPELYVTDGTPEGTRMLRDFYPGTQGGVTQGRFGRWALAWKDRLYFYALEGEGNLQLYATDGTDGGTQRLTPGALMGGIWGGYYDMVVFRDALHFTYHRKETGVEMWVTDGTPAGTKPIMNLVPGSGYYEPRSFNVLGDKLLFQARPPTGGQSLWATDGTVPAVEIGKVDSHLGFDPVTRFVKVGNRAVFSGYPTGDYKGRVLWSTDGTAGGTRSIASVATLTDRHFASLGDKLVFFAAKENEVNFEPWITDGTAEGTRLLKELSPGADGSVRAQPDALASLGGKVYFGAAVAKNDARLFVTDGTTEGTREIVPSTATVTVRTEGEVRISTLNGDVDIWGHLFVFDNALLFPANFHGDGDEVYRLVP